MSGVFSKSGSSTSRSTCAIASAPEGTEPQGLAGGVVWHQHHGVPPTRSNLLVVLSFCLIGWVAACGNDAEPARANPSVGTRTTVGALVRAGGSQPCRLDGREVKLSRDVEPILVSGCSGQYCHGLAMSSAARTFAFLVNQPSTECDDQRPLVTPGDPARSYLLDKITDHNLCTGHPMPRGLQNRLSSAEVDTVRDWICEGAPNN